jgi:aminomethyltransferase
LLIIDETIGLAPGSCVLAGLCLYGHDINETTSPVEANLIWSIQKRRRSEGGFIGADHVQKEITSGPKRKRVGIKPEGRAPAREPLLLIQQAAISACPWGFGLTHTVPSPWAMLNFICKGRHSFKLFATSPCLQIVTLPFIPHN